MSASAQEIIDSSLFLMFFKLAMNRARTPDMDSFTPIGDPKFWLREDDATVAEFEIPGVLRYCIAGQETFRERACALQGEVAIGGLRMETPAAVVTGVGGLQPLEGAQNLHGSCEIVKWGFGEEKNS